MTLLGGPGRVPMSPWPLFSRTLRSPSPDPSEAHRKKRVLHVFREVPDWQLTQIGLNGPEKSRTLCPQTKNWKWQVRWRCVFTRPWKKRHPLSVRKYTTFSSQILQPREKPSTSINILEKTTTSEKSRTLCRERQIGLKSEISRTVGY